MQYKKIIVRLGFLVAIASWVIDLFNGNPDALWAMVAVYFCIPLMSLTITQHDKARLITFGWIICALLLLVSRGKVYPLIAIAIFIGGTIYTLIQHNIRLHRRKEITIRWLSYIHSGLFAIVCAAAGTFAIMSKSDTLAITCDQVRNTVNTHISTALSPLWLAEEQVTLVKERVDKFFTQSPEQLIQWEVMNQVLQNLWWNLPIDPTQPITPDIINTISPDVVKNLPPDTANQLKQIQDLLKQQWINNIQDVDIKAYQEQLALKQKLAARAWQSKPVPKITIWQNTPAPSQTPKPQQQNSTTNSNGIISTLISSPLDNKQALDEKICDVVFTQIKDWSTKPGFKLSILLSLALFLYPLIRLIAFVYSLVLSVIYIILRQSWFISVVPEEKIVQTWVIGDNYQPHSLLASLAMQWRISPRRAEVELKIREQQLKQITATDPVISQQAVQTTNKVNDILQDLQIPAPAQTPQWWWTWVSWDDHIVTANSPQDQDTTNEKKDNWSHVDFGSFWGNFWQKFKQ